MVTAKGVRPAGRTPFAFLAPHASATVCCYFPRQSNKGGANVMATSLRDVLRGIEIFSSLDDETLEAMVAGGATMKTTAGGSIVEQGAMGGGLQLLIAGTADVLVNGNQVRTLSEGDYFGEMSLFDDTPRSASIHAGPDGASTFAISPARFGSVMEQNPKAARVVLSALARRIRELEAR